MNGTAITVQVTFIDNAGYTEVLTSAATVTVVSVPGGNTPATGMPSDHAALLAPMTPPVSATMLTADTSTIMDANSPGGLIQTRRCTCYRVDALTLVWRS